MKKKNILKIAILLLVLAVVVSGITVVVSAINKPNGNDSGWDELKHPWQEDFTGNLPPGPGGDGVKLDIGWNEDF
jgi:flagellar basal body-associated protein FliL